MDSRIQLVTFVLRKEFDCDAVEKLVDKKIHMLERKFELNEVEVLSGHYFVELTDVKFDELMKKINEEVKADSVMNTYINVSYGKCIN